ncbi:MAG: hypothetical protein HRT52_08560 [Colwellia sp.]|nr:hypothetical protein [Colwellia sp.]
MEFDTPKAIHQIKTSKKTNILVDGKEQCKLQAMSYALKYHRVDVTETSNGLSVTGTRAVHTATRHR